MAKAGNACSRISLPAKIVSKLSRNLIFWDKNMEIHSFACLGINSWPRHWHVGDGSTGQLHASHVDKCSSIVRMVKTQEGLTISFNISESDPSDTLNLTHDAGTFLQPEQTDLLRGERERMRSEKRSPFRRSRCGTGK